MTHNSMAMSMEERHLNYYKQKQKVTLRNKLDMEKEQRSDLRSTRDFWCILHLGLLSLAPTTSCPLHVTLSLTTRHYAPTHQP